MGFFKNLKKAMNDQKETDVSKMNFQRYDGFAGSAVQKFADVSVPVCPICGKNPHWLVHINFKTLKTFPVLVRERNTHLKCDSCGMIMHNTVREENGEMPAIFIKPSPRDNITTMTFDVLGDQAENFDLAGKEMTIWEINQMAEKK